MPIFAYFAVVGSALVALLFAADATLEKRGPLPFNSEFVGLPKAWHPETWQPETKRPILTATPAPAPDMTSEAVLAAAPPAAHIAGVPAAAAAARAEAVATAKLDAAPKKPKRVARRLPPAADDRQNYAWRSGGYDGGLFGGGMFGRF